MQVKLIAPWQDRCGVTGYALALKKELDTLLDVQMVRVPKTRSLKGILALCDQINKGDIAHIQYAQDFYGSWRYQGILCNFTFFLKHIRIPIVITAHELTHGLPFLGVNKISLKRIFYNTLLVPIVNWTPYGRFLRGRFLDIANCIIVHNSADKLLLESLNIDAQKVSLLYPGVADIETPNNAFTREELGLKDRRLITTFGFIRPHKGYETIIEVMKYLPEDVVFIIAGGLRDGAINLYMAKLKALISSSGLQDRVKITGYLDNEKLIPLLSISDVILFPYSHMTTSSYAFSYAIAAKRPIITSNTNFFSEIKQKFSAVKIFEIFDSQAIAGMIKEALDSHGQEPQGAAKYRQAWSWKNVAKKTYKIYCDILFKRT